MDVTQLKVQQGKHNDVNAFFQSSFIFQVPTTMMSNKNLLKKL